MEMDAITFCDVPQTGTATQRTSRLCSLLSIAQQEGAESLTVKTRIGMTRPIYSTASGKVLAAYLKEDEIHVIIGLFHITHFFSKWLFVYG